MNWNPAFAIVLLGVTTVTYIGGLQLHKDAGIWRTEALVNSNRKIVCWCFALLGLLPLLVFKYYNFLNESATSLLETAGLRFALPGLNWAIPVGISFFTFQAVGYLLDVYHDKITAEKNFFDYALFVSFFPQVTSGPISTAKDLMPQIKTPHEFKYEQAREGLQILLWGMFLKVVLADRLGIYVDTVYGHYQHYSGVTCFVASIFYTIQIYGDFAGYSLMAIGIAKTIGFDLINNFNRPYFATSITEFWKRWHISLTRWLTTHIYINLGGNRCSTVRQYMNIMITFLVSGLWHGANWTFVVWGALHGVFQILEKMIGVDPKGKHYASIESIKWLKPIRIIVTFLLVNLAWIFFRMPTINDALEVIGKICTDNNTEFFYDTKTTIATIIGTTIIVIAKEYLGEYSNIALINNRNVYIRWSTYLLLFFSLLLFGVLDSGQFIYVSF